MHCSFNLDASSQQELNQMPPSQSIFTSHPLILSANIAPNLKSLIAKSFIKEIETSELPALLVVDLISQEEKPEQIMDLEELKLFYQIQIKKLFDPHYFNIQTLQGYLENLDIVRLVKGEQKILEESSANLMDKNQSQNHKKYGSYSIRIFPFHKTTSLFAMRIPLQIAPLSKNDILSYQKAQRISKFQYLIALREYSEANNQKLETQVYYNWGEEDVDFILNSQNQTVLKSLKPSEILIIPSKHSYKIKSRESIKLLYWNILPKSTLPNIIKNLQESQHLKTNCPFSISQTLIDYCFHEFSLIEVKNEEFMCTLANFLNNQFFKELQILENDLKVGDHEVYNLGMNEKKIDECQICGKFIVNYFSVYKNLVYCLDCVKCNNKIIQMYQKMSKTTFENGCQILAKIESYQEQKQNEGQNVQRLMQNAVIFEFQDICDGDFVGSYNSSHCKIHETNLKKQKNSKEKIVQNTIKYIKKNLSIKEAKQIVQTYSKQKHRNQIEKNLYRSILVRVSNFTKKQEQINVLAQLLPNYQEDNQMIFAIQLLAKNKK